MPFSQCCIPTCGSKKHDTKLFVFPRNETIRKEWIKRIAPHYPHILEFSETQLMKRLICMRHFEPTSLIGNKRLHTSCPTLITEDEIISGIPLLPFVKCPETDHSYVESPVLSDHTYHKRHLSCPGTSPRKIIKLAEDISFEKQASAAPSTSKEYQEIIPDKACVTEGKFTSPKKSTLLTTPSKGKRRMRLIHSVSSLTPKCRKLYNKCLITMKYKHLFGDDSKKKHRGCNEIK